MLKLKFKSKENVVNIITTELMKRIKKANTELSDDNWR